MQPKKWLWWAFLGLLVFPGACDLPRLPGPSLTPEAARHTLERWNPQYCKVLEFYGFRAETDPHRRAAYVLLSNPHDPGAKPILSVAQFELLQRPDGSRQWFLISVLTHSSGLTRRQGWDNLLVPVSPRE